MSNKYIYAYDKILKRKQKKSMKALIITPTKTFERRFRDIYKFVDELNEKFGGFEIAADKENKYDIIVIFNKDLND